MLDIVYWSNDMRETDEMIYSFEDFGAHQMQVIKPISARAVPDDSSNDASDDSSDDSSDSESEPPERILERTTPAKPRRRGAKTPVRYL